MKRFAIVKTVDQNVSGNPNMVIQDRIEDKEHAIASLLDMFSQHVIDSGMTPEQEQYQLPDVKDSGVFSDDGKNYSVYEYECQTEGACLAEVSPYASNVSHRTFEVIEDTEDDEYDEDDGYDPELDEFDAFDDGDEDLDEDEW